MSYVLVAAGLVLLLVGGEALVRGAVGLADRVGVSKLVIGLTVVAFGTSAPELVVSVQAALEGAPGIAIGNVVGSNIANVLLVIGLPALIAPFHCDQGAVNREGTWMVGATLAMIAIAWWIGFNLWTGLALFAMLLAFLLVTYRAARDGAGGSLLDEAEELEATAPKSPMILAGLLVVGIAALVFGSDLLVDGARSIALSAGVPEEVVGVTLVALGTSLPELATTVVAAFRKHGDIAIGNVIGSNIFNILGILGITAMVKAVPVPEAMLRFDLWVMLGCGLLLFPFAWARLPVGRVAGSLFIVGYLMYVLAQFSGMSGMPMPHGGG
ncbi:MAG: calcium/sodium antiporter [Pseudomonadota bacterium]|nr:calcium/sodium antiporter [Pseudomonadota bacterium]